MQRNERLSTDLRKPIVEMRHVKKAFGYIQALEDMNFSAYSGEVTAIVGDNGSGKSTLIKILTGCLKPDAGEIRIKGNCFSSLTVKQSMNAGVTAVYQDLALDNCKDCAGNIFLGRELMKHGIFLDHARMRRKTEELLEKLHILIPDITQPVERMSGGQRQALAIARAVYAGGDILVFDEPTSAMGVRETARIMELFLDLKEKGKTIILISHNLFQVFDISDRICVIHNGRFVDSFLTKDSSPQKLNKLIAKKEEELGNEKMD
ncbi:MAG: sugar ABC transporter ATP-binding protein [Dorea sp.]|nr:sugar ABC transporter ATP-binding protein [Dorea sp.]